MLGIGVTTYNRLDMLKQTLLRIGRHTKQKFCLVVGDDGSSDGTADWCMEHDIPCVTGVNRGISWNKNRSLFALQAMGCTEIILLEEDCHPVEDGWDRLWTDATRKWHHLAFAHEKIKGSILSGLGTPDDPYVNNKSTAQCMSISREALLDVGFFDTRFEGYGVEHAEWTTRIKRSGRGFQRVEVTPGVIGKANLFICGGLVANDAPSYRDKDSVERNNLLFRSIKEEPIFREFYRTRAEMAVFLSEIYLMCQINGLYFDQSARKIYCDLPKYLSNIELFQHRFLE